MKQLTGILLTIILLCGCDNKINKSDVVFWKKSEVYLNSFVDSVTILPLKMEDDFFLGDINKINYIDSLFIILDKKTNAVFAFNELGQFWVTCIIRGKVHKNTSLSMILI